MGATRSHRIPRRAAHPALAAAIAAAALALTTACDPVGGLNSAAVAVTTDQVATAALQHQHVDIKWLTCTAHLDNGPRATPSAGSATKDVADVTCDGETKDGRPITVRGTVTQEVEGRCVKGDLTAKVADRTVFRASVLGDCTAPAPTTTRVTPAPGGHPTVTVTVTVTQSFQGK
ncbi:hypothetical protein N4G70_02550 [Streptomyces sp. ASQP_92]|uniref:hypothetical protein n=1 Tax=Streptomyces sp. ASQP_92 TaxID=2979116 RepID=UPI0021C22B38|nr:hypothetical protein [Streptomyces sp. ASQP_92]MCT9087739.1 hypothetical protein [Streptomyces sp. ASQP_92]